MKRTTGNYTNRVHEKIMKHEAIGEKNDWRWDWKGDRCTRVKCYAVRLNVFLKCRNSPAPPVSSGLGRFHVRSYVFPYRIPNDERKRKRIRKNEPKNRPVK